MDSKLNTALGLYIHIPFCHTKCTYCDFNTYSGIENLINDFSNSIYNEIEFWKINENYFIDSIFIGGGTPSYIDPEIIKNILIKIKKNFEISKDTEVTLEINPEDVTLEKANYWKEIGINRCSLGIQSLQDEELILINRRHNGEKALFSFEILKKVFNNISIDLIYGLPKQTKESYLNTLENIINKKPDHISCYSLQVEKGTVLNQQVVSSQISVANDDLSAEMYEITYRLLKDNGFANYEISNWSKNNKKSLHNLKYWTMKPYIGIGPGSHSYIKNKRFSISKPPKKYIDFFLNKTKNICTLDEKIEYLKENKILDVFEIQTQENEILEYLMLSLRLKNGIDTDHFKNKYKSDFEDLYLKKIKDYIKNDILIKKNTHYLLTEKGKLFANEVANNFVK
ncbi:MAG: radical SAM family heme chaperone HemW [Dehalococcoidales bacterium]|nr:radical SAM family heme chaperone HemW [Dehalococcoidales bacterium]